MAPTDERPDEQLPPAVDLSALRPDGWREARVIDRTLRALAEQERRGAADDVLSLLAPLLRPALAAVVVTALLAARQARRERQRAPEAPLAVVSPTALLGVGGPLGAWVERDAPPSAAELLRGAPAPAPAVAPAAGGRP